MICCSSFFSGFSLEGESELFAEYLVEGDLVVVGFSYGAQQAFEYVYHTEKRVDRLILLSPAFFQDKKPSFIRTQLRYFQGDLEAYLKQFLANVTYPATSDLSPYLKVGTSDELEALLSYRWSEEKIMSLQDRGVTVEVFLGVDDRIIDVDAAFGFFSPRVVTYCIKHTGHLLH